MKQKLLFCIQNLDIGGPQKSLLSLLYDMDYEKFEVDLMVWSQTGSLLKYIPREVNVLKLPPELSYIRLSKKEIYKNSFKLLLNRKGNLVKSAILTSLKYKNNMSIGRQLFWKKNKISFPKLEKRYDVAIAVSGGNLCYFICDCVSANRKFTWVRSDYRVFNRDKSIDKEYFSMVDGIINVSNVCKEIFDEVFPEFSDKTSVFYNLLPFKLYQRMDSDMSTDIVKKKNEVILMTISRLDPNKGLDLAVEAMKILKSKEMNVKWYILGDGIYKKELQKKINALGLEKDFLLLGFKNNTYPFIEACDIFVHPSRFEGKSNSVDEAKYACKPIVVTNYPTVKEQITHLQNGIVVNMDSESLSKGIIKMINDESLAGDCVSSLVSSKSSLTNSILNFEKIIL